MKPVKPARPRSEPGRSPEHARARAPKAEQTTVQALDLEAVVSGAFDAEQEVAPPGSPPKRVLAPEPDAPKLHKVLAQAGMGSRLEMEKLILEGRISVNGEPAHVGQRIRFGDVIKVNGKPVRVRMTPPPPRVLAYHKPVGEVVTHDDPQNRPTVFRRLPRLLQGKWQSVGRLDLNTEGLLLFTSSGELANRLMHPRFGLQREYAVRVLGALSDEEKQRLTDGIRLDDGMAQFGSIEEGGGEGANCWYRVTIAEGRNREVRRLFEAVGHAVSRLIRIRYGVVVLPRGLRRGTWVELDARDVERISQAAGLGEGRTQPGGPESHSRHPAVQGRQRGAAGAAGAAGAGASGGQGRGGPAKGRSARPLGAGSRPGSAAPDPMKTSLGYIGQDAMQRRQGGPAGKGAGTAGGRARGRRSGQ